MKNVIKTLRGADSNIVEFTGNLSKKDTTKTRILKRIVDQSKFDDGNNGGCQTASLVSAIEEKFNVIVSYDDIRKFYFSMDKYFSGRGEKIKYVLQYLSVHGWFIPGLGYVYAEDLAKIPTKDITFQKLWEMLQTYDYCGIAIANNSPFFDNKTGYPKVGGRRTGGHAMRCINAVSVLTEGRRIDIANSWGPSYNDKGICHIPEKSLPIFRLWECFGSNLVVYREPKYVFPK